MRLAVIILSLVLLLGVGAVGTMLEGGAVPPDGPDLVALGANTCTYRAGGGWLFFTGWAICIEIQVANYGDTVSAATDINVVLSMRFRPAWTDPPVPEKDIRDIDTYIRVPYTASVPALAPGEVAIVPHLTMPILGHPGALPSDPYDPPDGSVPYPPNRISVKVDPYNRVKETDETNNSSYFRVSTLCGDCSKEESKRCREYGPILE